MEKGVQLVARPDSDDDADPERKIQTHLEQINMNREYREISNFFSDVLYLHLVPQLLKFSDQLSLRHLESDPFGQGLLKKFQAHKNAPVTTVSAPLKTFLKSHSQSGAAAVQIDDTTGRPHLEMLYNHWRPMQGGREKTSFRRHVAAAGHAVDPAFFQPDDSSGRT